MNSFDYAKYTFENTKKRLPKLKGAKLAVETIVEDLCDRRGLKSEWGQIDEEIKEEIKKVWVKIINLAIGAKGGAVKSIAKAQAARENGKKGGRPRKKKK